MHTRKSQQNIRSTIVWVSLLLVALGCAVSADAADVATASKNGGATDSGFFPIGPTGQIIKWEANYFGSGTAGNDFYLHTDPMNLTAIPLSTSLSPGFNTGTYFLPPSNYRISITYFGMGPGNYVVLYNLTASISAEDDSTSPTAHDFGSLEEGDVSAVRTFTIENNGDFPVTIGTVTNTDSTHFEITENPSGDSLEEGETTTLKVRFKAGTASGTTPEPHSANITIPATAGGGGPTVSPVTITVLGTTLPKLPDIACCATGTPNLGSADHTISETKDFTNFCFKNTGSEQLLITSVTLINDDPEAPFSIVGTVPTTPLGDSASRFVTIRFTPPASGGERTYSGKIRIISNDPDEPDKLCPFRATAHHPVPKMRIDSTVLDYHQVELGFAFTKAVIIHNDGDADLQVDLHMHPTFPTTDLNHWDVPDGSLELSTATISPGVDPRVFRQVYAPKSIGTHQIRLEVTSNDPDPGTSSATIILRGEGIAPIPIDSVLVLDRSGSMAEKAGAITKIKAMQTAADMFTHILAQRNLGASPFGDKIGYVKYNKFNSVYLTLDTVGGTHLTTAEDKLSDAAIADVSRLKPDGRTGIGGAMQTAAGMLVSSPTDRKHIMVLLTDGHENEPPYIDNVDGGIKSADPNLKIYSVGLGSDHDPVKLQNITNVINGYHQVQNDLSGITRFDLEIFYFKILANATGMSLIVDPTHVKQLNSPNPQIVDTAIVSSSDRSVFFVALEIPELRAFYDLELIDPHGNVIVLGSTVGGVPVHQLTRLNYRIFRVVFPDKSLAYTYVGTWQLRLTPNGKWNEEDIKRVLDNRRDFDDDWVDPFTGEAPIGFAAAVRSNYRMNVQVLTDSYLPGADVKLTAELTDRGWPSPSGRVDVTVTTPDGTVYPGIKMYDDGTHSDAVAGDALFTTPFPHTAQTGAYKFFFHGVGKNERGELNPRQDTRYLTLARPTDEPVGPSDTPPGTPSKFEYAAKIVCGLQKDPKDMRLARGFYATAINIHNPNDRDVKFFKKLALTFPPEGQKPGKVIPIGEDILRPDEALKVDCNDIEKRLFPNGLPAPYIKGFVIIQSPASLDVTAVYTTATLDREDQVTNHSSIDVEQIRERLSARQPNLPDLTPVPDLSGSFCKRKNGKLVVTVKNQGLAASAPSTTEVDFFRHGKSSLPTPALDPGASTDLLFDIPPNCFDTDCEFKINVDVQSDVPETNEANNTAEDKCIG